MLYVGREVKVLRRHALLYYIQLIVLGLDVQVVVMESLLRSLRNIMCACAYACKIGNQSS